MEKGFLDLDFIVPLQLSEEERMLQETVRDFAKNELGGEVAKQMDKEENTPQRVIDKMKELGLLKILIPEKFGGMGATYTAYLLAMEELCRYNPAAGLIGAVNNSLVVPGIRDFGSDELKEKYLRRLADGEIGFYGLTEAGSGSDAFSLRTKAEKKGEIYILNGEKIFITNGSISRFGVIFAKTSPEKGHRGISAFVVERDFPGFKVEKDEHKLGIKGSYTSTLSMTDCEVPAENLIGIPDIGYQIIMYILNGGRLGIGAQALGIGRAMIEACQEFGSNRIQFGEPILNQQFMYGPLAEYLSQWIMIRELMYRLARIKESQEATGDKKKNIALQASMLKMQAAEFVRVLGMHTIQLHGGPGFTTEYPVERYLRDGIICGIYEGTTEVQKMTIASMMGWLSKKAK